MNILSLKKKLKRLNLTMDIRKGTMVLRYTGSSEIPMTRIVKLLYSILNRFENKYFILIEGLPYCILPDALDHVSYSNKKSMLLEKTIRCRSCRYDALCPGLQRDSYKKLFHLKPIPDIPEDIVFELNKTCNLSCDFCFYEHGRNEHLSFKKIVSVMKEAKQLRIKSVRFTGGEPFLRKDIFKILRLGKSMGFYVFLNTNATILTDPIIKNIEKYVDNILVSFNSYSESGNVYEVNQNFFKAKIRNIRKLRHSSIPVVRLGTIITRSLLSNFEKYSVLVRALGIKTWEFYRPMMSKMKIECSSDYKITTLDIRNLLKDIKGLSTFGINAYIANALPLCATDNYGQRVFLRGARFDDGHSRLVLDARGFFKPSYLIDLNLGETIKVALDHTFRQNLMSLNYLTKKCRLCVYMRWCLGGSRYMAHENSGDYFGQDPMLKS